MLIDYLSDLHMEKMKLKSIEDYLMKQLKPKNGDILLLNGDISDDDYELYELVNMIKKNTDSKMIFTFGNHETWSKTSTKNHIKELKQELTSLGVKVLINEKINLQELDKTFLDMNLYGAFIYYDFEFTENHFDLTKEEIKEVWLKQNDAHKTSGFFNENRCYKRISNKGQKLLEKQEDIDIFVNHFTPYNFFINHIYKEIYMINKFYREPSMGNVTFNSDILESKNPKYVFAGHMHSRHKWKDPKSGTLYMVNVKHDPFLNYIEQVEIKKED